MEFLVPNATEVPDLVIDHLETVSPTNTQGIKLASEARVNPVPAAIASGVKEALGVRISEMPLWPLRPFLLAYG